MTEKDYHRSDRRLIFGRIAARSTVIILTLALLGYLLVSAIAADRLTRPERVVSDITPSSADLDYEDVYFPARHDSIRIAAWYIAREEDSSAIVMVHGMNSSRFTEYDGRWIEVADALWQAGFSVLMIDLRGHGLSAHGRLTFGLRERRDVAGAVDWLLSRDYAAGAIGLLGVSMGGAAVIGAAAQTPEVGAVAADAAYADVKPLIEREWEQESGLPLIFWPSSRFMTRILLGYDPASSRPIDDVAHVAPRPLLLIHGRDDRLVPPKNAYRLQSAHGTARVWIIKGARHSKNFLLRSDAYKTRVASFFEEMLQDPVHDNR